MEKEMELEIAALVAAEAGKKETFEFAAAKFVGEPKDPRKPIQDFIGLVANIGYAEPEDNVYVFDPIVPTEKVYVITSSSQVTDVLVSPDTPTEVQFADYATENKYIKYTEYLKKKENTAARIKRDLNTALNNLELQKVIELMATTTAGTGNEFTPASGQTRFRYPDLIDMIESVQDYGDRMVLICGSQIDKDINLWNWDDNKYHSLKEAFDMLNVQKIRIGLGAAARTMQIDDEDVSGGLVTTSILPANVAYLIATSDVDGQKPLEFIRKRLNSLDMLGGIISVDGDKPERLVFAMSPTIVAGTKYYSVGFSGFEELAMACSNPYAFAKFTR